MAEICTFIQTERQPEPYGLKNYHNSLYTLLFVTLNGLRALIAVYLVNSYLAPIPSRPAALHYPIHWSASEIIAIKVMQTSLSSTYFLAAPHTHTRSVTASYMLRVCVRLFFSFDP